MAFCLLEQLLLQHNLVAILKDFLGQLPLCYTRSFRFLTFDICHRAYAIITHRFYMLFCWIKALWKYTLRDTHCNGKSGSWKKKDKKHYLNLIYNTYVKKLRKTCKSTLCTFRCFSKCPHFFRHCIWDCTFQIFFTCKYILLS